MNTLDKLADTMARMSRIAISTMRAGDLLPIQHEREQLIAWLGSEVDMEALGDDRILVALRHFAEAGFVRDLRQARLLCYGCTQVYSEQGERLIENLKLFTTLLTYLTQHQERTRAFRKCYRGLLNAYFAYDSDADSVIGSGRSNWASLHTFLQNALDRLASDGHTPQWVRVLSANKGLLGTVPCDDYRSGAADIERIESFRFELNIGVDSWFIRTFVQSHIERTMALPDAKFQDEVSEALQLLVQYPLYIPRLLGMLLDRYSQSQNKRTNDALRDFAIEQWGAPWIAQNESNWLCSQTARDMIANWGKKHLVHEFFHLFAAKGADNTRRAAFWNLYSEDLKGMYFALGSDAFEISNRAFLKFRNDAKGLVVKLNDSKHNLHAVILQFEKFHIVEFNQQINVAYFYDTAKGTPEFYLSKGWVNVGALSVGNALKGNTLSQPARPMQHSDEKHLSWEGRFAQELGRSDSARQHFCERHHATYSEASGKAWIKPNDQQRYTKEIGSVLQGWGYTWSPEVNGYFRSLNY
ncbi:MAG: hypothetical protein KKG03_01670 [Gammaproteobacteria bacterium]|nr:hypothetical protein [Sideroxydans sp.]MBU4046557.1 hypothetical protein [Gammaproteobacteria bacterium]MBU4150338.1 hypothetical protein [Gammaproteobacteria bacterium]